MDSKIILFNGGIKSGKDTAINHLFSLGYDMVKAECKEHLHELTMKLFNVHPDLYWSIYNDRELKDKPNAFFQITRKEYDRLAQVIDLGPYNYLTVRQAMIYVSEVVCKPAFGKDYFGRVRASKLNIEETLYVDGSCGFPEELPSLIEKIGQDNILLLRVHRKIAEAPSDSRGKIPDGVITNTIDVHNDQTLGHYLTLIEEHVADFTGVRL